MSSPFPTTRGLVPGMVCYWTENSRVGELTGARHEACPGFLELIYVNELSVGLKEKLSLVSGENSIKASRRLAEKYLG